MLQKLNDTVTVNDWNSCFYHVTSEVLKLMSVSLKKKKGKNPCHFHNGAKDSEAFIQR